MEYCKECGAPLQSGKQFCTACGAAVDLDAQQAPVDLFEASMREAKKAQSTQQTAKKPRQPYYPAANEPPQKGTRYAVMSIGSYIGTFILMGIPLVNVLLVIIWSCGGCKNQNKRNYARALLIVNLIVIAVGVGLYLAGFRLTDALDQWTQYLNTMAQSIG